VRCRHLVDPGARELVLSEGDHETLTRVVRYMVYHADHPPVSNNAPIPTTLMSEVVAIPLQNGARKMMDGQQCVR
jgi:hypothetical protein